MIEFLLFVLKFFYMITKSMHEFVEIRSFGIAEILHWSSRAPNHPKLPLVDPHNINTARYAIRIPY